jgi:hypothetical protein
MFCWKGIADGTVKTANGKDKPQFVNHFVEWLNAHFIADNVRVVMLDNSIEVKPEI